MAVSVGVVMPVSRPPTISAVMAMAQIAPVNEVNSSRSPCQGSRGKPCLRARITVVIIIATPMAMPGMAPPRNSLPTDMPDSEPTMIIGTLGGIIGPTVDDAAVTAAENAPG